MKKEPSAMLATWIESLRMAFKPFVGERGLNVVLHKELSDHFNSRRFEIVFILVIVSGLSAMYVAAQTIRTEVAAAQGSEFVFLRLFTTSGGALPPFVSFVAFLGPLIGLVLGFDAINGERVRNTLSRVLAQPIHRDSLINAKFLAGIIVIGIMIVSLGFLVCGLGLTLIGVPPLAEELWRILIYLGLSVVYVSFWLSLSILFSIVFRQTATSALSAISVWIFFTVFSGILSGLVADAIVPVAESSPPELILKNIQIHQAVSRVSPPTLYEEAVTVLLTPQIRTLGPVMIAQMEGAIPGTLPLGQSLLLIWPHLVSLIAGTLICFAISYIIFIQQEVRSG